jgi:hypothetical protein
MHALHGCWPCSPGVQRHLSETVYLDWQVYCSGGQRKIRGIELLGLIEEKRELILNSSACRQRGEKNVSLVNKKTNWPAGKLTIQKVFPFCGPSHIFPTVNLFLPFLWKRNVAIISFLPFVNAWTD